MYYRQNLIVIITFMQDREHRIYVVSMYETHARRLLCEVRSCVIIGHVNVQHTTAPKCIIVMEAEKCTFVFSDRRRLSSTITNHRPMIANLSPGLQRPGDEDRQLHKHGPLDCTTKFV